MHHPLLLKKKLKSRFQAIAAPVENEQQVKEFLELNKDISTTHQCWAWKIGHNVRFNDDGEPSGTAGRPILATIEGNDLTNIIVMVNRWYGGIKLGTGTLFGRMVVVPDNHYC